MISCIVCPPGSSFYGFIENEKQLLRFLFLFLFFPIHTLNIYLCGYLSVCQTSKGQQITPSWMDKPKKHQLRWKTMFRCGTVIIICVYCFSSLSFTFDPPECSRSVQYRTGQFRTMHFVIGVLHYSFNKTGSWSINLFFFPFLNQGTLRSLDHSINLFVGEPRGWTMVLPTDNNR